MPLPLLKVENAIVCEHIAAGGGNRPTLINVFSGDILAGDMPAHLLLAFYLELRFGKPRIDEAKIEVRIDSEQVVEFTVKLANANEFPVGNIQIPAGFIAIEKESELSVWAKAEGYRDTCVLKKRIIHRAVSEPRASSAP